MSRKRGVKKAIKAKSVNPSNQSSQKKDVNSSERVDVIVKSKVLGEAPREYHFVLKDGKKLGSIHQLIDELEHMSDDVFSHHVNDVRNDFSNWVEDIFDEKKLAEEIRHMRNKFDTQRKLMRRMINELLK